MGPPIDYQGSYTRPGKTLSIISEVLRPRGKRFRLRRRQRYSSVLLIVITSMKMTF
jgi:hypothetical protein